MTAPCVTHHHACACREARIRAVVDAWRWTQARGVAAPNWLGAALEMLAELYPDHVADAGQMVGP